MAIQGGGNARGNILFLKPPVVTLGQRFCCSYVKTSSDGGVPCPGWGAVEDVPVASGEVAFEAASRLLGGLAFGGLASEVVAGLGVAAGASDGDGVMAALIWRLPPRSRRWRLILPELTGVGASPTARASLASLVKRSGAGDLADQLGRGQGPEPWL